MDFLAQYRLCWFSGSLANFSSLLHFPPFVISLRSRQSAKRLQKSQARRAMSGRDRLFPSHSSWGTSEPMLEVSQELPLHVSLATHKPHSSSEVGLWHQCSAPGGWAVSPPAHPLPRAAGCMEERQTSEQNQAPIRTGEEVGEA